MQNPKLVVEGIALPDAPIVRHGQFDIQGGGGAWTFGRGRIFFRTKWQQDYFFAGPSGRIIFFIIEHV